MKIPVLVLTILFLILSIIFIALYSTQKTDTIDKKNKSKTYFTLMWVFLVLLLLSGAFYFYLIKHA